MRRYRRPPRLAPLASEGGGTEKRTLHVLQKPDISFATDTAPRGRVFSNPEMSLKSARIESEG